MIIKEINKINIECKCKGCKYRRLGCHTICSEYKKFQKECAIARHKEHAYMSSSVILHSDAWEKQYIKYLKNKNK